MKHTPGPWHLSIGEYDASIHNNGTIAYIDDTMIAWKSNAQAIAALPDLLEACENVVEVYDKWLSGEYSGKEQFNRKIDIKKLRQSISNAKGNS